TQRIDPQEGVEVAKDRARVVLVLEAGVPQRNGYATHVGRVQLSDEDHRTALHHPRRGGKRVRERGRRPRRRRAAIASVAAHARSERGGAELGAARQPQPESPVSSAAGSAASIPPPAPAPAPLVAPPWDSPGPSSAQAASPSPPIGAQLFQPLWAWRL